MPHTTDNINEVIMIVGEKRVRFPAMQDGRSLGLFLQDMLASGYTAEHVGSDLVLTAPRVEIEPLPKTVSRLPSSPRRPIIRGPKRSQRGPNSKDTPSNVVSLEFYRHALRSRRDFLVVDCQGESA